MGFTKNKKGELSIPRSILAGAVAGCVGASFASPFYMVIGGSLSSSFSLRVLAGTV